MFRKIILSLVIMTFLVSCGGGIYTKQEPKEESLWGNVTVTTDAFVFGSDYPADIVIPDIDGMRNTAFVVSIYGPSGVIPIDLDSNPLSLSKDFTNYISPQGTGTPSTLFIKNNNTAFLLTSSHLIIFNPTTGETLTSKNLLETHTFNSPLQISSAYDVDGDGANETTINEVNMSFPGGISAVGKNIYITMSNLINPILPAVAAPGILRIFEYSENSNALNEKERIITSDFNPTGITKIQDNLIAITNSGLSDIYGAAAHPLTNSSIDIIDTTTDTIIDNISFGPSALSFQEIAITSDSSKGFIGSASYGEMYEIDFINMTKTHYHQNPITITGNSEGSDYISSQAVTYDDSYLFAGSFDYSSIYPVDISGTLPIVNPEIFPSPFVLGYPKGVSAENPTGTNTGVGAIAVRPGAPGIDYDGADLFALTGNPGTLVAIDTHGEKEDSINIKSVEIEANNLVIEDIDDQIQLYLKVKLSNGYTIDDVTESFTNPYGGEPITVKWSSSNLSIATINSSGLITPLSSGETIIRANIGQMKGELLLTINTTSASGNNPPEEPEEDDTELPEIPEQPQGEETPNDGGIVIYPGLSYTIPNIQIQIDPELLSAILEYWESQQNQEDPEEPETPETPDEIEILTEAPAGTDPFADGVVEFNPGEGAGFGSDSFPDIVLGPPGGTYDVLSLGMNGEIILEMTDFIIADGVGPDFTIFENAFYIGGNENNPYSEPAIVSVSDDGVTFYDFDCNLNDDPLYPGCAGTKPNYATPDNNIDPTDPKVSGGNSFDLSDVGLETARFIKITDAGLGDMGTNSKGFDLNAAAVINGTIE